jgi:ribosomal protein S18 acetylase RimI-like enzyme
MTFSFRKAGVNDCSRIRALASRIWEHTYGSILSKDQLDYMFEMMYDVDTLYAQISTSRHQFFIVSAGGIPAGYLAVEKKSDGFFIFQKIYALPEFHGIGIGRFMVEQVIDRLVAISRQPFRIELYVNRENPAVKFYEHLGFVKTGVRDYHIGEGYYMNDFIMSMDVNPASRQFSAPSPNCRL